ncbi:MAG: ABC transporter substrate-binding protein [Pseudomonadota bacterium]
MFRRIIAGFVSLLFVTHAAVAVDCPESNVDVERLVIAGGSITEIVFELGAESLLVAVDSTSNYPMAAAHLPQIGYVRALSAEGVLSRSPSLVIGEDDTGPPEVLAQLKAAGVEVAIVAEQYDAAGVINKVRCVAQLIGRESTAEKYIADTLMPAAESLNRNASKGRKPRGMVLLGIRDGTIIAAGKGTSGEGLLALMTATNALDNVAGWKPISVESMLLSDPDFLVIPQRGLDAAGGIDGLLAHPTLRLTKAAQARQVYAMDGMAMLGFGPRTLESAARLSAAIRTSTNQPSIN